MIRYCLNPECRRKIEFANGYVIARDFLAAIKGDIPKSSVRELCGVCVFRFENHENDSLDIVRFEKLLAENPPNSS